MSEISYDSMQKAMWHELNFISSLGVASFVYPFVGRSKPVLFCYGLIFSLVLLTATQLLITLSLKYFNDWIEIVNVVPNLAVVLIAELKYYKIHANQVFFQNIFKHFHDELWDIVEDCKEHKKIMMKYIVTGRYVGRFLFYYSLLLVVFVVSFPRVIMYLEKLITGEDTHLYPFDGWYPFDKINWYYVAYIWEGFMTCVIVCIYGFKTICSAVFTIFLCMELKVLGYSIETLITPDDIANLTRFPHEKKFHVNIKKRLRNIIIRHQLMAQIIAEFDGVLGDAMFLNFVFGSVFITLTIFTATVVENIYMQMRYFFMFCSLTMEVFQQCVIGQILSDHSEELTQAIYSSEWTYADNDTKQMLLILMTRTQKLFQFTANGYMVMNLQSFSGICKTSYQFFNLLYTAYK